MNSEAKVRFWGTRGSLAKPGRKTLRYGGNTSCVQVTSPGGALVIIDCGTGAHELGQTLLAEAKGPLRGTILISHTHWDHIQGFPFFAPLFVPGGHWDIYGPHGLGGSLRDALAGQMEHTYFPVNLEQMGASIRFHDLLEGEFEIDDIRITTRYLNHPALTLGYRLEMGATRVVYACDHEPYARPAGPQSPVHELDLRHSEFLAGADLVIHDAQFTDREYAASRKGWGHSPVEYVLEMAQLAGVKRLALSHHDPGRTDDELDGLQAAARLALRQQGSGMEVFSAADGQELALAVSGPAKADFAHAEATAIFAAAPAIKDSVIILGVADAKWSLVLAEAARSAGVRTIHLAEGAAILRQAETEPPALLLLEDLPGRIDGLEICRTLRANSDQRFQTLPIVVVAARERVSEGRAAGVTRWLIFPFTTQYAEAQIEAWIMRSACRWVPATRPEDEDTRLAALRELAILDTPLEERFDRITRVAAAFAGVPLALVSLVDEHRQWFKSCPATGPRETSRELSFCAHAVANREPLIVPDTFLDERFADNPLVAGEPRIRFYAGFPVFHANGSCLGTLCLVDMRPRQFPESSLQRMADLARLVEQELNADARRG